MKKIISIVLGIATLGLAYYFLIYKKKENEIKIEEGALNEDGVLIKPTQSLLQKATALVSQIVELEGWTSDGKKTQFDYTIILSPIVAKWQTAITTLI